MIHGDLSTSERIANEIESWYRSVEKALVVADRRVKERENLFVPYYPKVLLPSSRRDLIRMLNWKVWCMRYHINLETLLTILLQWQQKNRAGTNRKELTLGISVAVLTSVGARQVVEEAVTRMYPSGENQEADLSPASPPPLSFDYDSLDEMNQEYSKAMLQRHKAGAIQPLYRRPWRRA